MVCDRLFLLRGIIIVRLFTNFFVVTKCNHYYKNQPLNKISFLKNRRELKKYPVNLKI